IQIETKSFMPEQLRDMQKISGATAKIENALWPRQIEFNFANAANVNVNPAVKIEIFRPVFAWIFDGVALADLLKIGTINCFNNSTGLEWNPGSVKKPAGMCATSISYRFYSKWLATKVLVLNDERATPAVLQNDSKDYVPTNRWMVFGHHFAAIAGPGPLVGPVLAAQFGFLPGTLWILIGATLGGAVHDMIVLFASVRRGGKTLGRMVKEEIGGGVGTLALVSVLAIMIILLAVL